MDERKQNSETPLPKTVFLKSMPATSSGGDVRRATLTELRAAIDEVRNVQLNICQVFHKICNAERKDCSSKHVYKHARTCLRSAQLAFTLLEKTFMDILQLVQAVDELPVQDEAKMHDLHRHWMLALNTRELAFKSHEEAQQRVQEAEAESRFAQARMREFGTMI